ncbi:Sjoegren syndrome nuclear autoantigen 1 [Borealophlyctis nickersoniae]|nr:Sjoegren syndrome nuclear autoantigen 1 [Borealophlyctis nickersoniae]
MSTGISPSTLQQFNNDLVKRLQTFRDRRDELGTTTLIDVLDFLYIHASIQSKQLHLASLERQLSELTQEVGRVREGLFKECETREEVDRVIQDTEEAYEKIVESSQALLKVVDDRAKGIVGGGGNSRTGGG